MPLPSFPESLIPGCRRAEPAAQEALYRHFEGRLLHVCLRYVASRVVAEDLVQETFIRVFQRLGQFCGAGPLEAWVRRIGVNTCLDHCRAEARGWREVDLEDVADDLTSDEADAPARLAGEELVAHIQRLPTIYRLVINLYCIEGYSHAEIGARLGIDEKTSSSQLARARRLLAEQLRRAHLIQSSYEIS